MTIQNYQATTLPYLDISGMEISNNATTPNTQLDISAGICRDSNNVMDITFGASFTNFEDQYVTAPVVIDATTTGVNGLDTGSLGASKLYAIFAIGDSTFQRPAGAILTLAYTSSFTVTPLMPSGYDSSRLIGYAATGAGSTFLNMQNYGYANERTFVYGTPVSLGNVTATSYTAVTMANIAPIDDNSLVDVHLVFAANAAADVFNAQAIGASGDQISVIAPVATGTANTTQDFVIGSVFSTNAAKFNAKVSAGTATLTCKGFKYFV